MRKFESIQFDNVYFDSQSNWNLKMLFFYGEGKTGVPEKKSLGAKERTNNKLNQPSHSRRRQDLTGATSEGGGECFHHCAIPTHPLK